MILSPDGHCRPFDAAAAGTRAGAGAGIVVLKRLRDALADRDTIHAVISGAADQQRRRRQGRLHRAQHRRPGRGDRDGSGAGRRRSARASPMSRRTAPATPLGDPIEIAALTRVFRASTPDVGFCRLGSLKANLGHLDAAAGVAGLIKTVLALTAPANSTAGEFPLAQPAARSGAQPVHGQRRGLRRGLGRRARAAPASAPSGSAAPTPMSCSRRRRARARGQPARSSSCWSVCHDRDGARAGDRRSCGRPGGHPDVSLATSPGRCRSGGRPSRIAVRWSRPRRARKPCGALRNPRQARS